MLRHEQRILARDRNQRTIQRTREKMRPDTVRGGGEARNEPEATEWFDGEVTRSLFLLGVSAPDSNTYVPPPQRPPRMTAGEWVKSMKEKYRRRRILT